MIRESCIPLGLSLAVVEQRKVLLPKTLNGPSSINALRERWGQNTALTVRLLTSAFLSWNGRSWEGRTFAVAAREDRV
jgi:hypothetical protein